MKLMCKNERKQELKHSNKPDAKTKAIGKALDIDGVPVTHIRYGNKRSRGGIRVEKGGKKIYVLKQQDKDGKNIEVPEDKLDKMLSPIVDQTNDTRHRADSIKLIGEM